MKGNKGEVEKCRICCKDGEGGQYKIEPTNEVKERKWNRR